jgi:competence protein ComEC
MYALQLSSFPVFACIAFVVLSATRRWTEIACFAVGVILFGCAAFAVIDNRLAKEFEGDSILTEARVVDFPKWRESSVSLVLTPVRDARLPDRLRVSWFEPSGEPRLGDIWQFELRLERPRGNSNAGGFDYEGWLLRERVGATGYVVPGKRNLRIASGQSALTDLYRARLADRIARVVRDEEAAAVLVAIALGTRHWLTQEQWERYAQTGTGHLMAISGLHVGLAALAAGLGASILLGVAGLRRNNYSVALVLALCVAGAYVAVSGFAVPAQRALLMLALGAVTVLRSRRLFAWRLLATTCMAVVVANPLATMEPGFKLSFSAVAVLLWMGRRHDGPGAPALHRPVNATRKLVVMQFLLLTGLLPLTVLVFARVALLAPFANLVAVPLFSAVTVPAALLGLFAGWDPAIRLAAGSIAWIERLIVFLAQWPVADTTIASVGGAGWILVFLPLLWALLPPGWPGRRVAWLAMAALLLWKPAAPVFGCARVTMLDVGQGLAVVVQTRRHVALYDTGPAYRGGSSAADRVVLPFLAARGIRAVDTLLVSHADLDHAGGLETMLQRVHVGEVLTGEHIDSAGPVARLCRRGDSWLWDGIRFQVLHPAAGDAFEGNDASCVLRVQAGSHGLVITGDIEMPAERSLVRTGMLEEVLAVTVPHHGSRTSSGGSLVERLSPDYALVAAGHRNRWGFPKSDVTERWRSEGATVMDTARSGAIQFEICQRGGVRNMRRERELLRRFWHEP